MNARLFHVLHHTTDENFTGVVADCIHINFSCVFKEAVNQDRTFRRESAFFTEASIAGHLFHCTLQSIMVVNNLHRTATQDIARTYEYWESHSRSDDLCFFYRDSSATWRLWDRKFITELIPLFTIFCKVNGVRRSSGNQRRINQARQLQWSLAAKAHNHLWWDSA